MIEKATYKKTLVLDFDGVIHSYVSGWKGATVIPDPPVEWAFAAIDAYLAFYKVAIYSSRSKEPGGIAAMQTWFRVHGYLDVNKLEFPTQKPAAFLTIDDRAICFNGTWPTIAEIDAFKPWYQK